MWCVRERVMIFEKRSRFGEIEKIKLVVKYFWKRVGYGICLSIVGFSSFNV